MGRGAWQTTVHEIAKIWTKLSMHAYRVSVNIDV